jgi:hypothetical protein
VQVPVLSVLVRTGIYGTGTVSRVYRYLHPLPKSFDHIISTLVMVNMLLLTRAVLWLLYLFYGISLAQSLSKRSLPFSHRSNNHSYRLNGISLIRGGAKDADFSHAPSHPSISSIGQASAQLATSIWDYTSHVVSKQIVPIVQNPNERIIVPMKRILKASNNYEFRDSLSTDEAVTKVEPEESRTSPEPRSPRLSAVSRTASEKSDITDKRANTLKLLLLPRRLLKIGGASFILCECLDLFGILNEETPLILKSQVDRVWYGELRPRLSDITFQIRQWWKARENIRIPLKYEFALGATAGMMASPLFSLLTASAWQPALLLYGLAELNAYCKSRNCQWNLGSLLSTGPVKAIGASIERILEKMRGTVHKVFSDQDPTQLLTYDGTSFVSYQEGRVNDVRYSLGPAPDLVASKQQLEFSLNGQRLPRHGMIRHGFFVGGALGLFAGV